MTRYKLLKSSISLEDFEDLLAFLVAGFEFDKNQNKLSIGPTSNFGSDPKDELTKVRFS